MKLVRAALTALLLCISGCASHYFHDGGSPPTGGLQYPVSRLPFSEYWTGIVFNGDKIGYTRFTIRALPGDRHEIASEASFVLRFLGIEKKVHLRARDVVNSQLELMEFAYDYRIDGSTLLVSGARRDAALEVTVVTGGESLRERHTINEPVFPTGVVALYPVVAGLQVGREYRYLTYDGQLQRLATVEQRVEAYERSEFFEGSAFKITTSLHGQRTTTWIDALGRPVFELAMRGVMISALEDEARARRYVALAAVNQRESLIEFSLVRPDRPIANPRRATYMKFELRGLDRAPPDAYFQRCQSVAGGYECEIQPSGRMGPVAPGESRERLRPYLEPSPTVQSRHPNIGITARQIAGEERDPGRQAELLLRWMQSNIERAPFDVFSALDVLDSRKAECQGHAYLFAALARALGIPTRVVSGLVYSEELQGFLFHSWTESWLGDHWQPIDPTFGQATADATHVKLLEGEALADLLPLIDWVGRFGIRMLALEHQRR